MTAIQKLQAMSQAIAKSRKDAERKVSRLTLDELTAAIKDENAMGRSELVHIYAKRMTQG